MDPAVHLVALIVQQAPELRDVAPTKAQYDRALALVDERTPQMPKGDPTAFAALVDLVVHELTN